MSGDVGFFLHQAFFSQSPRGLEGSAWPLSR